MTQPWWSKATGSSMTLHQQVNWEESQYGWCHGTQRSQSRQITHCNDRSQSVRTEGYTTEHTVAYYRFRGEMFSTLGLFVCVGLFVLFGGRSCKSEKQEHGDWEMRGTEAHGVKQRINKKLNMQTSNQTNLLWSLALQSWESDQTPCLPSSAVTELHCPSFLLIFETGVCCVAKVGLELIILLPQLPKFWITGMCYHACRNCLWSETM